MAEYTEKGLSLRWDAPGLIGVAPQGHETRIIVAARPAHPSNVVTAVYAVDNGALRTARGFRLPATACAAGEEWFAVDLPRQADEALVTFMPVLSCSGREADPRRGGFPFTSIVQPLRPAAAPQASPARPRLEPFGYSMDLLGRVTARLEKPPATLGETIDGLHVDFPIGSGGTVEGPRLNGEIEHAGGDWMFVRRDGIGLSEIRVLIRTRDGAVALGAYGGVVDFGSDGYDLLAAGRGPERASVQLTPRYLTSAPGLLWLNRLQCVGLGRVTLATLIVEYDLYAVRSLAAKTA
jgi:Protein of unknown function (DUF3237)